MHAWDYRWYIICGQIDRMSKRKHNRPVVKPERPVSQKRLQSRNESQMHSLAVSVLWEYNAFSCVFGNKLSGFSSALRDSIVGQRVIYKGLFTLVRCGNTHYHNAWHAPALCVVHCGPIYCKWHPNALYSKTQLRLHCNVPWCIYRALWCTAIKSTVCFSIHCGALTALS